MTRDHLISDGIQFLKSITEMYGAEQGIQLWEKIAEVIDPALKGDIFFKMLVGDDTTFIRLRGINQQTGGDKVAIIRAIRSASGLGLKEAKDIADAVFMGTTQEFEISRTADRTGYIQELRALGCIC